MLDRDGGNKFALGLTAIICLVLFFLVSVDYIRLVTEQRVSEHYARQDQGSIRSEDIAVACAGLPLETFTVCVVEEYEEAQEWDQERRDLHAQEKMALWAFWMFIVTALALAAILRTLHHTKRAADAAADAVAEARKATGHTASMLEEAERATVATIGAVAAAHQANEITAANAATDQRPWLHVEISSIENSRISGLSLRLDDLPLFFAATVFIRVKNSGRTPARNVFIFVAACSEEDMPGLMEKAHERRIPECFHALGVVPPNSEVVQDHLAIRPLADAPISGDFRFECRLMCMLRYDGVVADPDNPPFRTIQAFSFEDASGPFRTISLSTEAIRENRAKLATRLGFGNMS